MGRVIVTFELMNDYDLQQFNRGLLPPERIRKVSLHGVYPRARERILAEVE